jgi:putative tricarboxylic transport membrane protein
MSDGSLWIFVSNPLVTTIMALGILLLCLPLLGTALRLMGKRQESLMKQPGCGRAA